MPLEALDPTVERVRHKLLMRSEFGMIKYGTTVHGSPLTRRQWLVHAQAEAMDLAVYLQRLIDAEYDPDSPSKGES